MKYAIIGIGETQAKLGDLLAKLCSEQGIKEDEVLVISTQEELMEFKENQRMQEQFVPERMKPIVFENIYANLPPIPEIFYPPKIHPKHQHRQNNFKKKKRK